MSLKDILRGRKCFKLVCGAGNEDAVEVEKLVALYARAGANYFDLSAREEVVEAAFRGVRRVAPGHGVEDYYFNVSVGIKGDPHVNKAEVDNSKCVSCGKCVSACINRAITFEHGQYKVNPARCLGSGSCVSICPVQAISHYPRVKPLDKVLPPLIKMGIHSIELHAVSDDEEEIAEKWRGINSFFSGVLSLCVDRTNVGDIQLIRRIKRLLEGREDYSTIIQGDGAPMSGGSDDYETTLQAVATAHIVQKANLPVFLMLSGGTNSKTTGLASLFGINAHGIALGSFARVIVREYINREDFLENKDIFNNARTVAACLVEKSLKYLR